MTPSTKYAYDRLWALHEHSDLQEYGPDLLIQDVETVVAALAHAERDLAAAEGDTKVKRAVLALFNDPRYREAWSEGELLTRLLDALNPWWHERKQ